MVIGGLAVYYFHQRYTELATIVTERCDPPDDATMVASVIRACSAAAEQLTIIRYQADPSPACHQNADV